MSLIDVDFTMVSNVVELLLGMCIRFGTNPGGRVDGRANGFRLQIDPLNGQGDDIFGIDVVLRCRDTGGSHRGDTNRTGSSMQCPDVEINMMTIEVIGDVRRFSSPCVNHRWMNEIEGRSAYMNERYPIEISAGTWRSRNKKNHQVPLEYDLERPNTLDRIFCELQNRTEQWSIVQTLHFKLIPSIITKTLFFFASSYKSRCSANVFTAGFVIITWIWRRIASRAMSKCVSSGVKITQASPGLNASRAWR